MASSFIACSAPHWEDGHFSTCVQQKYIALTGPLVAILMSSVRLFLTCPRDALSRKPASHEYQPLPNSRQTDAAATTSSMKHVVLANGSWRNRLEGLLLLASLASFVPLLLTSRLLEWTPLGLLCSLCYLLALWILRQLVLSSLPKVLAHAQVHSGLLYALHLLFVFGLAPTDANGAESWTVIFLLQVCFLLSVIILHITSERVGLQYTPQGVYNYFVLGREQSASLFSYYSFSWVTPLVWKAFNSPIATSDLYSLDQDEQAEDSVRMFYKAAPATCSLLRRLLQWSKRDLVHQAVWAAVFSVMSLCPAILLRVILDYLNDPKTKSRNNAWICVSALLATGVVTGIADCQCEWIGRKLSMRLRAILINEIFSKVLKRRVTRLETRPTDTETSQSESEAMDGNVLNLMTMDTTSISEVGAHMHLVWMNFPLQLAIATIMLHSILGISGVLGVLLMMALLPLNVLVSNRQVVAQTKVLNAADNRIQAANEVVTNIQVIKLCTWEKEFQQKVRGFRSAELLELRGRFLWWSISMTVFYSLPYITTILTLFLYTIVEKKSLETKVAFPALAIFAVLRIPLDRMSASISFMAQAHVSLGRIESFLHEREVIQDNQATATEEDTFGFENATLVWNHPKQSEAVEHEVDIELGTLPHAELFRLCDLHVRFCRRGLNVVLGDSGSGKSSLLLALLGEMDLVHGKILSPAKRSIVDDFAAPGSPDHSVAGEVAYCPQQPWIMNRTIRTNIVFGMAYDIERYKNVLDAVELTKDLTDLERGDLTVAGERGERLSGGQKQRVALARALYSNALHLILDDCLSALDALTGKRVFFQALNGALMENRTCILATHHSRLVLPHCHYAVLLEGGRITAQGKASDLPSTYLRAPNDLTSEEADASAETYTSGTKAQKHKEAMPTLSDASYSEDSSEPIGDFTEYQEEMSTGAVPWSVIKTYLQSMGSSWFWIGVTAAFSLQQLCSLGTSLWIKAWAHEFDKSAKLSQHSGQSSKPVNSAYYLGVYGLICLSYVVVSFIRDVAAFSGALKASARIFDSLLTSIVHADPLFFDKVPSGQIVNRFSRDIGNIDQEVTIHSMSTFYTFCSLATIVILISALLPMFLPAAAVICLAYYFITKLYINSARDLKRLESVKQSPLYQQFQEAFLGSAIVRAYGQTGRFLAEVQQLIDGVNQPYFLLWAAKEWLTLRIACISALISWLTGVLLLLGLKNGAVTTGVAGLVLTYAATFTDNCLWFAQLYAIVQQSFNSVERVVEYTNVKQEPTEPLDPLCAIPLHWPDRGDVRFSRYCARYAPELDLALEDVSFEISAGRRVAIVGRTGAGKSTVTLALVRALEADSGQITIDGINIASTTLERLRQAVTVVPQNPTLFRGSLRDNIDPLHHQSDADIQHVLGELQFFHTLPSGKLQQSAAELSLGQRQLVCIARAILRRSRILVLDEATASVDHATDALIQSGIRSSLAKGTTVITIAHRLVSVADYDHIVVLDAGRVVEQGSTRELLARRGSAAFFRQLCEQSGELNHIERIATASSTENNLW